METVRVYRNINARDKFLGMELADGCMLVLLFTLAFSVNKESLFLNGLVMAAAYVGLRGLKRGKPDGYASSLARHLITPRFKRTQMHSETDKLPPYGGA